MGGGQSPRCLTGTASTVPASQEDNGNPLSSDHLAESPILLLVFFHKAFREELALLRQLAQGSHPGAAAELRDRFRFLKLAYKYHCTAEDEVVFLALDTCVDNIACSYSLEHRSIDDRFDSLFRLVEASQGKGEDNDPNSSLFQEIMFSVGTIQASICKHMQKEEEQVFPKLMEKLPREEQSALVWQFLCSVPIVLLEDMLPWVISFLSPEEKAHVISCVMEVVPKEEPLQELVSSWLQKKNRASSTSRSSNMEKTQSLLSSFPVWHSAIRKDFEATLVELHQLRSSMSFSSLQSVIVHLKFLADVLTFYSNALDQLFYPVFTEISGGTQLPSLNQFAYKSQIESLQRLLHCKEKLNGPDSHVVDRLCGELESWATGIARFFAFHEEEVFDRIIKNCSHETQQQLLYSSIRTLPLGLLKCLITWFSTHLTDKESASVLDVTKREDYLQDKSFTSLLHEWFRVAFTGKTSLDKFRRDLQGIFRGRFYFVYEEVKEVNFRRLPEKEASSRSYLGIERPNMAYSSGINLHVHFPVKENCSRGFPSFLGEDSDALSALEGEMPIDIVYYFHKALKKDLESLVLGSFHLTEEPGMLENLQEQFRLVRLLYQVHSNAEDEIAFPALEAKGKGRNISHSYTIDHKLEVEHFDCVNSILDKMSRTTVSSVYHELGIKLQDMCRSLQQVVTDHIHHEEIEIWSLFRNSFSVAEQEKIAGSMLGRTRAEILQEMIPWLMGSLSQEEHQAMMRLWKQVTRSTMFSEWLQEWWDPDDYNVDKMEKPLVLPSTSFQTTTDPLEIISTYLSGDILKEHERNRKTILDNETTLPSFPRDNTDSRISNADHEAKDSKKGEKGSDQLTGPKSSDEENISATSQEELEAAIRRVSRDSSLDSQKKAYIIQNLLMSRWIIMNRKSESVFSEVKEIPYSSPSYRDPERLTYGCEHYKKNCKLLARCCNQLFTCRRCHDEATDHVVDRKSVTEMMCMNCLVIQPIGPTCATASCNNLSMGKYYCTICKIHDDDREIYHCPYCNLCRVGKGLGIDYFHCMNCNACMSRSLSSHICREKCFEDNCPICHEHIFTSSNPIKGLPCGHLMHSTCFQDYTCSHYTCPICSKSLGDMQVYFQMLDTLLAEEKMPDEYLGQTQVILCNDCEKRGSAPFHWLYHKCPYCGSYNTRLL
ncbi:zinc finger protein BRUTUS-like At1g18910 [Punica granatum]|uniref:Zinc finger protein BRUTUS-like At1g18910 n=1 Tax=Punica granatum TaxID=22663 RepID=A0A6P8EMD6_PUNGR|nr:zinc finger protein BRUTUS-like At1g18910 [Punica granatum]